VRSSRLPSALLCALVSAAVIAPFSASAAQRPSANQAQALLQARPELIAQLRARIQGSGLTPAQVRARLEAEGYPPNLLDAYLGDSFVSDSSALTDDVFSAVSSLGIADSAAVDSLRWQARGRRFGMQRGDSLLSDVLDSLDLPNDSLPRGGRRRGPIQRDARRVTVDSGFTSFGQEVFDRTTTQFDANLAGPVDANYRLGPGDRLVLILTGDVEAAYNLDVTREGFVVVPQVGQISVANLTLGQLNEVLYSRLGRVYSGVRRGADATTRFSISVARLRSNQVYVVGDVAAPGSKRISSAGTVLTALYAAGGPTENGNMRAIELRRGGRVVGMLDLYDYLLHGDASRDLRLETGDVVFVPPRGARVRIWGEVVRPATYELKPGETLADIIRAAGGFLASAERRRVQIERILPPTERSSAGSDRIVMDVASEQLATGFGPAVALQAGDVVRVFAVANRVASRVNVRGHVWSPGAVGFTPGIRVSQALRLAGGLKPDAYLGQVLISRLQPDSTRTQLRTALQDTTGRATDDVLLADGDEIQVFSQTEFRPKRYVVVTGAVRNGGRFPYREGMTVRDLVLLAGGLEEGALLSEAEVARMPENRAGGVTAQTMRVSLDSSYLFDRVASASPAPLRLATPRQQGGTSAAGDVELRSNGDRRSIIPASDVELQPYDNVLILRQQNWSLPRTVFISGEVAYPGRYTLATKSERLSDLIERAGGLTRDAYASGIVFVRKDHELGRIGVDLPSVIKKSSHRDNLILVDGDSITIPIFSGVVNVRGAVNSPVAVAYVPGRDIDYYISASGGVSRKGIAKHAYVTQPNGKVESRQGRGMKPKPQPGSQVFVPEKDPNDRRDYVLMLPALASALGSLVAIVVALAR
jgi:polysaccharide export outer membrane protein